MTQHQDIVGPIAQNLIPALQQAMVKQSNAIANQLLRLRVLSSRRASVFFDSSLPGRGTTSRRCVSRMATNW